MSNHSRTINLKILDKDYVVSCPEHESSDLLACAHYLSEKMQEVKEHGKTVSTERLLVMTALNIVHEFLQYKAEKKDYTDNTVVERLEQKIELALKQ
jgi:cell division protein ZapA